MDSTTQTVKNRLIYRENQRRKAVDTLLRVLQFAEDQGFTQEYETFYAIKFLDSVTRHNGGDVV